MRTLGKVEEWRNGGSDAGMLLMCSDDTEEGTMKKNGEMNADIRKENMRYTRLNATADIPSCTQCGSYRRRANHWGGWMSAACEAGLHLIHGV